MVVFVSPLSFLYLSNDFYICNIYTYFYKTKRDKKNQTSSLFRFCHNNHFRLFAVKYNLIIQ